MAADSCTDTLDILFIILGGEIMAVIAADLGGTKLATALFDADGGLQHKAAAQMEGRRGHEVGDLIRRECANLLRAATGKGQRVEAIGIGVPGIYQAEAGTVWAPNIPGWDRYPLLEELTAFSGGEIPVSIESDRSCCILGEIWKGAATGCRNAIFLAVGTGIGAGIVMDGRLLRGAQDIGGAVGWLALNRPFNSEYARFGCFEYHASGDGIARLAGERIAAEADYKGALPLKELRAEDVFRAYESRDPIASKVLRDCIELWGMAAANLISTFNPEAIVFGGGVFGPAVQFLEAIRRETEKWAQPIAFKNVRIEASTLGGDAPLYGAAFAALDRISGY